METAQRTFPIHVRTGWVDFSPALHWHITQKVESALERYGARVRSVTVLVTDQDADRKTCAVDVVLRPAGLVAASATGTDAHDVVGRAADRVRTAMQRRFDAGAASPGASRIA
jgi:hypothetical protein